jgi:mRNA interferase MazF
LKRGQIVLVRSSDGPATKARPCLIIQRSSTLDAALKVTVCPLSSEIRIGSSIRPLINPSPTNGLHRISQIELDWIYTFWKADFRDVVGCLDESELRRVDEALKQWLDL